MHLPVIEKHRQPYAMVHGGVLAWLVDSAAYWAVFAQINDGSNWKSRESLICRPNSSKVD